MVADALAYHPTVAHYLKYVASTVGRDKFLRTLQYFSRFYAWYLYRLNGTRAEVAPYEAMKKQFGLIRKSMRLGKFVEHFKAAAIAADSKGSDPVLKYCAIGRQLGYAGYMLGDNIAFWDAAGIRPSPAAKQFQARGYQSWFAGLSFSIVAGVYQLYHLRLREQQINKTDGESVVESKRLAKERNAVNLQLICDVCDITVPSTALGYREFDDGIVGILGVISSLIGVYSVWQKTA